MSERTEVLKRSLQRHEYRATRIGTADHCHTYDNQAWSPSCDGILVSATLLSSDMGRPGGQTFPQLATVSGPVLGCPT